MPEIPLFLDLFFCVIILVSFGLFYQASGRSSTTASILIAWLLLQSIVASTGFYSVTQAMPPRFLGVLIPIFASIIWLFTSQQGTIFIDRLNLRTLTYLHTLRIAVEWTIFGLYVCGAVPEIMTYEGRNFDIFSGVSAPIIAYLYFDKKKIGKRILLAWNILCLLILMNIIYHGILSVPTPFQKYGLDQPNVAMLRFPYLFIPGFVAPLMLFAHLVAIRRLMKSKPTTT